MRILLLDHYAGSPSMGMEFRPYYFAREWQKQGHQVLIVGGDYSHLRRQNPVVDHDFQAETVEGVNYLWLKTGSYSGNNPARALSIVRFIHKLEAHAQDLIDSFHPDVVIASSTYPMETRSAQAIAKAGGIPYVHEIHDMWPRGLIAAYGFSEHNPMIRYIQRAENDFCRHADAVVSIPPATEKYLLAHGMPKGHFYSVGNGIIKEDWLNPAPLNEATCSELDSLKADGSRTVCFFGSFTKSYCLDTLLEAAELLKGEKVAFALVGGGVDKGRLVAMQEDKRLDNVHFIDPIPKAEIPSLLSYVDAIYIGMKKGISTEFGITMNKMYDAMASGRPIVFAVDAPNNYIRQYDCGVTVESENAQALASSIHELCAMDKKALDAMGARGRDAAFSYFEYGYLSRKFADILQEVIDRKRGE